MGIVPVAPTVTSGGQTIYFETINTAQVGLNPDDGPSPRQPRIAVTNIESLELEQAVWSREGLHGYVCSGDRRTKMGPVFLRSGFGRLVQGAGNN